jgi:tetratricopeptide (TPR) repeat protein
VHVNVQLIRVSTDEHLWAESYNRKLDDVFGVEGEVASAIADQLNAKLSGTEQKAVTEKPTQNAAAYDAYLRGLAIGHNQYGYTAYQQGAAAYAQAVQLDPNFALAWAHLAVLRSFLYFNGIDTATNSAAAVKEAADRAMTLQPELAEAWIAQGAYRYRVLRDFAGALQAYAEASRRAPNNALAFEYMAYVERRLGRWNEALAHYQKATELDPLNFELFSSMGSEFLNYLRRFPEAHAALDRAASISPNDEGLLANQASLYQAEGRLDEAAKLVARIGPNPKDDFAIVMCVTQAMFERRFEDAITIIQKKVAAAEPGKPLDTPTKLLLPDLGYCQEWSGQNKEAQESFARAVAAIKPTPDSVVVADSQGTPFNLALAYAGLRDKEKALAAANDALAVYANDAVLKPNAEAVLAQIQARFGDHDSAIAAIPHLLEVPAGITPPDLKFNPLWDPLRKDPRFEKLCQQKQP